MDFVVLRTFDNYIEANIVLTRLQDEHINCHLKDEHTITIDPLLSPALGGMKLMVHAAQVERASELLREAEQEYLSTIPCPRCAANGLKAEYITTTPKSLLGVLAARLLRGSETETKRWYVCTACRSRFKELPKRG